MNVLVVEDDAISLSLLKSILLKDGHTVDISNNGFDAFNQVQQKEYDTVITDWMMPRMNGIELIQRIKGDLRKNPKIVVITTLDSNDARTKAFSSGADEFIAKPIRPAEVIGRVRAFDIQEQDETLKPSVSRIYKTRVPDFFALTISAGAESINEVSSLISSFQSSKYAALFLFISNAQEGGEFYGEKISKLLGKDVHLMQNGLHIMAGNIYIAPEEKYINLLSDKLKLSIRKFDHDLSLKPPIDSFMKNLANTFGEKSISVVLSGRGSNGATGSGYISAAGGFVIAQSPKNAKIASMPQSVIHLRIADEILPICDISKTIDKHILKKIAN